jgi:hypothetical protein
LGVSVVARRIFSFRSAAGLMAACLATVTVSSCTGSSKGSHPSRPANSSVSPDPAPSGSGGSASRPKPHPTTYPTLTPATGSTPAPQRTKPAIGLRATGAFGRGVTGKITAIRSVHATAKQPGEIAGPALAITLRLDNGSSKAIDLANAIVNLYYGPAKTPGNPMSTAPNRPFRSTLAAGHAATAIYVFTVPTARQQGVLTVEMSYSPTAPVVVFRGRK